MIRDRLPERYKCYASLRGAQRRGNPVLSFKFSGLLRPLQGLAMTGRVMMGLMLLLLVACSSKKVIVTRENRQLVEDVQDVFAIDNGATQGSVRLPSETSLKEWNGPLGSASRASFNHRAALSKKTEYPLIPTDNTSAFSNVVSDGTDLFTYGDRAIMRYALAQSKRLPDIALPFAEEALLTSVLLAYRNGKLCVLTLDGHIMLYDVKANKVLWSKHLPFMSRSAPVLDDRHVLIQTSDNLLLCADIKTGNKVWEYAATPEAVTLSRGSTLAVAQDKLVVAFTSGEVFALDKNTGGILWADSVLSGFRGPGDIAQIVASPVIDGDRVFVMNYAPSLLCYNLESGERIWEKKIGGIFTPLVAGNYIYVASHENRITAIHKLDGAVRWSTKMEEISAAPILVNSRLLVPLAGGRLVTVDTTSGKIIEDIASGMGKTMELIAVEGKVVQLTQGGLRVF